MKIGIIQVKVDTNIEKNIQFVQESIQSCINQNADIIVLPEMWNTPYHNDMILNSIKFHDQCFNFLLEQSKKYNILLVGGTIARQEVDKVYNTCHIFENGKEICRYDKMHLFEVCTPTNRIYRESDVFTPGNQIKTFESRLGKFGILICYDIRFPELPRLLSKNGAKIIFCPAAFNQSVGKNHWQPLLQTRAMENEVFFVGVNPQVYTYNTFTAYGHSIVTNPFGKVVHDANQQNHVVIDIDINEVEKIRKQMPFWQIRREDIYELKEKENERYQSE